MEINKTISLLCICCLSLFIAGCGGSSTDTTFDDEQQNNEDNENQYSSTIPSLSLLDGNNPTYAVTERTSLRVPFQVQDADTNIDDMEFLISIGTNNNPNFTYQYSIDTENSTLNIEFGSFDFYPSSSNYATFSVSDGVNTVQESFNLVLNSLVVSDYISLSGQKVFSNVDYDINFIVRTKNIDEFQIFSVEYQDTEYNITDPLNIRYDLENKVFSLNANNSLKGENVPVEIIYGNNEDQYIKTLYFDVLNDFSANETDVYNKIIKTRQQIILSNEFEEISKYLAQYMFSTNKMSANEFEAIINEISNLKQQRVRNNYEFTLSNYENEILSENNYYADDYTSQQAIESMDQILLSVSDNVTDILELTNELIINSGLSISTLSKEQMNYNLVNSRFIGNLNYGNYVDGDWIFNENYSYLKAPIQKLRHTVTL